MHECDGLVSCSMAPFEPEGIVQGFTDFLALSSRKVYIVGPLVPHTKRSEEADKALAAKSPEIINFMEEALRTRGKRSLIYVCSRLPCRAVIITHLNQRRTVFIRVGLVAKRFCESLGIHRCSTRETDTIREFDVLVPFSLIHNGIR